MREAIEGWARRVVSQRSGWAMRSRLEPIKAVARMIDRRLDTGGCRNVRNFQDVIYFSCGGLRLYP